MATLHKINRKTKSPAFQVSYDVYVKDSITGNDVRKWKTEQFDDLVEAKKFKAKIEKMKLDDTLLKPSDETVTKFLYRWI